MQRRQTRGVARQVEGILEQHGNPTVSKQVKSASLEAASSSTCGGGWAPSGWGLALGVPRCPEPPGAPWEGTAGELEHREDGHFDGAATQSRGGAACRVTVM